VSEPETFMKLSGIAVQAAAGFTKFRLGHPDMWTMRTCLWQHPMRTSGSAGGHHGLESIEQHMGTRD